MQREPGSHAGSSHLGVVSLQSSAVAHGEPSFSKPVRAALQICGCARLHLRSFTAQVAATQLPFTHSSGVAHFMPSLTKAVRFALHPWGCPSAVH
jgi:hypothetical protein